MPPGTVYSDIGLTPNHPPPPPPHRTYAAMPVGHAKALQRLDVILRDFLHMGGVFHGAVEVIMNINDIDRVVPWRFPFRAAISMISIALCLGECP